MIEKLPFRGKVDRWIKTQLGARRGSRASDRLV
jgi:hypothetical protein